MQRQFRIDRLTLDAPGVSVEFTPDEFAVVHNAVISRSGIFEYNNSDGSVRRELRPESAVFADDSMRSFAGKPFTDNHPARFVTPATFKEDAAGSLGDRVFRDTVNGQPVLRVSRINVHDANTIQSLRDGKRELSAGYWADYDPTPGVTPQGDRFDGTQTRIEGNHVALVDKGRAGFVTRLPRIDSADGGSVELWGAEQALEAPEKPQPDRRDSVPKRIITDSKGIGHEVPDDVLGLVTDLQGQIATQTARADTAEGKLAAANARVTELENKPRFDAAAMQARRKLEREAQPHLPQGFNLDTAEDDDIRRAVITARMDGFDLANRSPEFIAGLYSGVINKKKEEWERRSADGHRADSNPAPPAPGTSPDGFRGIRTDEQGRRVLDGEDFQTLYEQKLARLNPNYRKPQA
jgi:hypothetical protein